MTREKGKRGREEREKGDKERIERRRTGRDERHIFIHAVHILRLDQTFIDCSFSVRYRGLGNYR